MVFFYPAHVCSYSGLDWHLGYFRFFAGSQLSNLIF